jgi:hypothetical protein
MEYVLMNKNEQPPLFEIRHHVWQASLRLLRRRAHSETLQEKIRELGFIDYDPQWNILGMGVDPEWGEYLTLPLYSGMDRIQGFYLLRKTTTCKDVRVRTDRKTLPEALLWGDTYKIPYTVVCSTIQDGALFLSQNRDMFNIKFNILIPITRSRFRQKKLLHRFCDPDMLIFTGNESLMPYYSGLTLKKDISIADLRAGNVFMHRYDYLQKTSCK